MENTEQQSEFIDLTEIGNRLTAIGRTKKHITRNLREAGYTLYKVHRKRGRSGFAITTDDAEKFLSSYERVVARDPAPPTEIEIPRRNEERIRQQRESEGWFSFRLASVGMPDLINLKPNGNGLFTVLFEEVKGPKDSLRKEQHAVLEAMTVKGIPSTITWL